MKKCPSSPFLSGITVLCKSKVMLSALLLLTVTTFFTLFYNIFTDINTSWISLVTAIPSIVAAIGLLLIVVSANNEDISASGFTVIKAITVINAVLYGLVSLGALVAAFTVRFFDESKELRDIIDEAFEKYGLEDYSDYFLEHSDMIFTVVLILSAVMLGAICWFFIMSAMSSSRIAKAMKNGTVCRKVCTAIPVLLLLMTVVYTLNAATAFSSNIVSGIVYACQAALNIHFVILILRFNNAVECAKYTADMK